MAPRIPLRDPTETPPDVEMLIADARAATGGATNVFLTMAHHPGLLRRYMPFAGKLLNGGKLPARDRELLILRSAHHTDSEYEWVQHERIGASAGLTKSELVAIQAGPDDESWSEHDARLLRACDELLTEYRLRDATWDELAAHYDRAQLIEIILLPGQYAMLAALLNTVGVEVEPSLRRG